MSTSIIYHKDLQLAIEELGVQQRPYEDLDFDEKFHLSSLLLEEDHHLAYEGNTIYTQAFYSTMMDILINGDTKDHEKFYELWQSARKGIVEHCEPYLTKIIDHMADSKDQAHPFSSSGIQYIRAACEKYYSV